MSVWPPLTTNAPLPGVCAQSLLDRHPVSVPPSYSCPDTSGVSAHTAYADLYHDPKSLGPY